MRTDGPTQHSATPPTPAYLASSPHSRASGAAFNASGVTSTRAMSFPISSTAANIPSQSSTTCRYRSSAFIRRPNLRLCSSSAHPSTPYTAQPGIWQWTGVCLTPPASRTPFSEIRLHTNKFGCTMSPSSSTQFSALTGSFTPSSLTISRIPPSSPSSSPSPKSSAEAYGCFFASRTSTAQT